MTRNDAIYRGCLQVRKGKLVGSMEMGLIPTPRYKPYHPNGRRPVTMENSKAYNRY